MEILGNSSTRGIPCDHARRRHPRQTLQARTRSHSGGLVGARSRGTFRRGSVAGDHACGSCDLLDRRHPRAERAQTLRRAPILGRRQHALCRRRRRWVEQRALCTCSDAERDVARGVPGDARQGLRRRALVSGAGGLGFRTRIRSERHALLHVLSVAEPRAAPRWDRSGRAGVCPSGTVERGRPHLLPTSDGSGHGIRPPAGQHGNHPESV